MWSPAVYRVKSGTADAAMLPCYRSTEHDREPEGQCSASGETQDADQETELRAPTRDMCCGTREMQAETPTRDAKPRRGTQAEMKCEAKRDAVCKPRRETQAKMGLRAPARDYVLRHQATRSNTGFALAEVRCEPRCRPR